MTIAHEVVEVLAKFLVDDNQHVEVVMESSYVSAYSVYADKTRNHIRSLNVKWNENAVDSLVWFAETYTNILRGRSLTQTT